MKNKKSLIALIALAVVGVVGSTFAYFTTTQTFTNTFSTEVYKTVVSETFIPPTDWQPGDEVDKVVNVKNEGNVPVAVRVKLVQKWVNSLDTELPLQAGAENSKFDVAVINFTNADDWTKNGDWYYYNTILDTNDTTKPLFESVTYNSLMTSELAGIVCETDIDDTTHTTTQTCTSGSGYAGGKYTLEVTVQTVQADAALAEWGYDPAA